MAEAPKFTAYETKPGDRWDTIALKAYRNSKRFHELIMDNQDIAAGLTLPVGKIIYVRIMEDPETGEMLPPWKQIELPDLGETDTVDSTIPVNPVPVELAFANGYPKVIGNKIHIAVNKNYSGPYSIEKESGGVVVSSPLYIFSARIPVISLDILDGDFYIVKVGPLTSGRLTVAGGGTGLAFSQNPTITQVGTKWQLKYALNKGGAYPTSIKNTQTNTVVFNDPDYAYTKDGQVTIDVNSIGDFQLDAGGLLFTFKTEDVTETGILPAWLTKVVYNFDPNGHEMSMYVNATADLEILVRDKTGAAASGTTWGGLTWDANTWIPGTDIYANGFNEVFRVNGTSFGQGGMSAGKEYTIRVRRVSNPGTVFTFTFKAPLVSKTQEEITFNPILPACEKGPFIVANSLSSDTDRVIFTFDAVNVKKFKWRVKSGSNVVRDGVTDMVNLNGTPKFNPSNRPTVPFVELEPGNYSFEIEGAECSSGISTANFTVLPGEEIPEEPNPGEPSATLLGTYEVTVNGRRMTYQKSPEFVLTLNSDGTLTDVTPGTVHGTGGNPTTRNGKNVFYMFRYRYLCSNGDGNRAFVALKNIYIKDNVHTISAFECDPVKIPTFQAFVDSYGGYPIDTGVNKFNARMSQITLTLHTLVKPGIPLWLTISRKLNFIYYIKNRAISKKIFAIESINDGENPASYHAKDVRTQTKFDHEVPQPYTCRTWKWDWDLVPGMPLFTDSDLFNFLRNRISAFKLTPDTVITDEVPENAQGQDPNIGLRVGLMYKGAIELLKELFPGITKRLTGLFGSYGGDRFYGLIDPSFIFKHSKSVVAEYLSTKVHSSFNVQTNQFNSGPTAYYASDQHKYRNVNIDYYFYFGAYRFNLPLELIFTNERIKIGSKTYQGQDNESDWIVFGTILSQSLMRNDLGQQIGPEEFRTGDLIPFPNGEILSQYNTPIAGNAGEHWDMGFWACLLGRGTMLWDGGGVFGQDPTKLSHYTEADQYIRWIPTGGERETYNPGSNGAPLNQPSGMKDVLYSTVIDATMAGHQAALELEGYADTIYYASYQSSRRTFVAQPGQAGYHLNGFGPLNIGMLAMKDAVDQKCGASVIGHGTKGKFAAYNNGFLSPHEFEENVTLTYGNDSVNLGTVYGGQTVYVKF